MKILEKIDRIPGGIILTPMLCTALINTFFPGALQIGGITTKLFSTYGTQVFIGVMLFLAGSQFSVKDVWAACKRSGVLFLSKLLLTTTLTMAFLRLFGNAGFFGISALAFCITIVSVNPGTYLAVCSQHGDRIDLPGFGLFNLLVVPSVPIVILGALGGAKFDFFILLPTLIPFLLGMLLGNLDPDLKALFAGATRPMLFFAGCDFGAAVNIISALKTGISGIVLALLFIVFSSFFLVLVDRKVVKRPGYGASSLSNVAGASVSMPVIVAEALPEYSIFAETATAQIACCVVLTTVFATFFTKWVLNRYGGATEGCTE